MIAAVPVFCTIAIGVFAADIVRSALAADASNGKQLAELWCSACHVVTVS
jgi:cytochrome c2